MSDWTVSAVADLLWRISLAWPERHASAILTASIAAGISHDEILAQVEAKEKFRQVNEEWKSTSDSIARQVIRDVTQNPYSMRHSQEAMHDEVAKKMEEERIAFFTSRGVDPNG